MNIMSLVIRLAIEGLGEEWRGARLASGIPPHSVLGVSGYVYIKVIT